MGTCLSCLRENGSETVQGDSHVDCTPNLEAPLGNTLPEDRKFEGGSEVNSEPKDSVVSRVETNHPAKSSLGIVEKFSFHPRLQSIRCDGKRSSHSGSEFSENRIHSLFEQYRDPNEDVILSEGIEKLCRDLEMKPEEFRVLLLAWKLGAEQMCRFTRREFVEGCRTMRTDSIQGIRCRLSEIVQSVQDPDEFKDLYRFTFRFGLEPGHRTLPTGIAVELWRLVFSQRGSPVLDRWLHFLEKHPHVRGIPRDTWNMFLNFSDGVGEDLGSYDDTEAWPSLFDDFVEYENDQINQNVLQSREKDTIDFQ